MKTMLKIALLGLAFVITTLITVAVVGYYHQFK